MNDAMQALRDALPQPPDYAWDWAAIRRVGPLKPLIGAMADTPQEAAWHGEGDVWAHTTLVCEALAGLAGFRALPEDARRALALAALLHDAGKTLCTRMEAGRWVSPHHAAAGAHLARGLLWRDFGLCGEPEAQALRESACLLIRHHTRPLHLLDRPEPGTLALRLAADGALAGGFTLRALCLLAEADALGRVAPDVPELLEAVALSRELAAEEGCLDGPYPFPSDVARRALFVGRRVWKDQPLFDDTWGEVTLMCGLPGTGKDTWLRANCPDLPTVCLDDIRRELGASPTDDQGRVSQAALARADALLRARRPFAWNATCLTGRRGELIDRFERYGARVRVVYLETEWAENLRRNAGRPDAVPEAVVSRMLDRMEPPAAWEARTVRWLCR